MIIKTVLLLSVLFLVLLQELVLASNKLTYIVYLGGHSHGLNPTAEDFDRASQSHHEFLGSSLRLSVEGAGSAILHSYTKSINGFLATLDEEEALEISRNPRVISVFPNMKKELHTTRSWSEMHMDRDGRVPPESIMAKANFGQDIIIANLDTGVWPESKSFEDDGIGAIPPRWKGRCQSNTVRPVHCNRKLIGAQYFRVNQERSGGSLGSVEMTPRDVEGHGSHTLSTAGGSFVPGANIFGYANGTAKGGSPRARVAAYKVCWPDEGCQDGDILAGFDAAIHDGVDVISVSLGGNPADYSMDPVAIGSFHAAMKGIVVVCSAGNKGPTGGTVSNLAPWILTVGASTIDRAFPSLAILGNKNKIKGQSIASAKLPPNELYHLINAGDAKKENVSEFQASSCYMDSLDPKKAGGKIVICRSGDTSRVAKGGAVLQAGGVGMIVVGDDSSGGTSSIIAQPHLLPATDITSQDGVALQSYLNSTKSPMGSISAPTTQLGVKPSPYVASFSSRGPNLITPQFLKPDITAPGVSILAAFTQDVSPTGLDFDKRRVPYILMSGTSMSCPHVSGVVGLLRKLHPEWSPSAIKSAIMTTARTRDNTGSVIKESDLKVKATPFAYGAGHIRPNRAMDPGLVYDMTITDYLQFLCAMGYSGSQMAKFSGKQSFKCPAKPIRLEDLNYPSITAPNLTTTSSTAFTVSRRLKNVGAPGTYKARVVPPFGVRVSVQPRTLQFGKIGEEKEFKLTLAPRKESVGVGYVFGGIIWSDGKHYVRTPLAFNVFS